MCIILNHEKTTFLVQDIFGDNSIFRGIHAVWDKGKIFTTWMCNPLKFQTYTILSSIIYILKYQRSRISDCKDTEKIRRSEFVAKTQFLCVEKMLNYISVFLVWSILCMGNLKSFFGVKFLFKGIFIKGHCFKLRDIYLFGAKLSWVEFEFA